MYFKDLTQEELKNNYDLESKNVLLIQDYIVKMISIKYFGEELSFERLMNSNDKTINVCLIELFTYFFKNKQLSNIDNKEDSSINIQEMQKLAILIGRLIAEKEDGLL
jgi:hypothetical protein